MSIWTRIKGIVQVDLEGGQGVVREIDIIRPNNATAYTANDVVNSNDGQQLVIKDAARKKGGGFYLHSVTVIGDQGIGAGAEVWQPRIWLWRKRRDTQLADNAVFTGSMTIVRDSNYLGNLLLPALTSPAGSTIDESKIEDVARLYQCAEGSKDIYFDLQTLTAYTPVALSRYRVQFHLSQV